MLDSDYRLAVHKRRQVETTRHRRPVHENRAAAAEPLRAALAGAIQVEPLLQDLDKVLMRSDFGTYFFAVEGKADSTIHPCTLFSLPAARRVRHKARGRPARHPAAARS